MTNKVFQALSVKMRECRPLDIDDAITLAQSRSWLPWRNWQSMDALGVEILRLQCALADEAGKVKIATKLLTKKK